MSATKKTDIESLVSAAQSGNGEAINALVHAMRPTVEMIAMKYIHSPLEKDDLVQEGMIGLFKAIQDYDKSKEAVFSTFAELCISRQLYSAVKSSNRKKNIPLNTYVSIYSPVYSEQGEETEGSFMVDHSLEAAELSPEEILIDRENVCSLRCKIEECLSAMEKQVFDLYMEGMTYQEIARHLDKEPKSIDNALQRIKSKVNKALNK